MKFNVARTAHTAYSTENENDRWDGSQGWLTNGENQGTSRKRKTLRKRSRGSSRSRSGYYAVIRARVTRAPTRRKIYDGITERQLVHFDLTVGATMKFRLFVTRLQFGYVEIGWNRSIPGSLLGRNGETKRETIT